MKIKESTLRKIVRREARTALNEGKVRLSEGDVFTSEEYRRIIDIIRAELARVFHTFYRKRNFWT